MVVTPLITQNPTRVEVALDRPPQPAAYPLGMGQGAMRLGIMGRATRGLAQGGRVQQIDRTQILSNALGARGGAAWQGNALPCISFKSAKGELRECGSPLAGERCPSQQ